MTRVCVVYMSPRSGNSAVLFRSIESHITSASSSRSRHSVESPQSLWSLFNPLSFAAVKSYAPSPNARCCDRSEPSQKALAQYQEASLKLCALLQSLSPLSSVPAAVLIHNLNGGQQMMSEIQESILSSTYHGYLLKGIPIGIACLLIYSGISCFTKSLSCRYINSRTRRP